MRKILLGTTAVVGLALGAQVANAQTTYSAPVGITGAGPLTAGGSPAMPTTPTTSGLTVRLGGFFDFTYGSVSDNADSGFYRNWSANNTKGAAGFSTNANAVGGGAATAVPGSSQIQTPILMNYAAATTNARGRQRTDMRTEAEINLYVDGIASNGMRYGAVLELQMDSQSNTGVDYDEMFGFVKGSWGELRFGQEDAAGTLMQVQAPATLWMGSSAAWDEFIVDSTNATNSYYGTAGSGRGGSAPYLMAGLLDGNDSTKIIYLSPQFAGFDVGFSYAPNTGEGERQDTQRDLVGITNVMSAALRYRGTFGPVGVQASLASVNGRAPQQSASGAANTSYEDLSAYSVGLVLSGMGLQVGGEYTWGRYANNVGSAQAKGLDDSNHWLLGAVYTTGALSFGVNYGVATQDNGTTTTGANIEDRTQKYLGVGTAYVIAPGMTLFANYNQISDKNIPTATPSSTRSGGAGLSSTNALAQFNANGDTTRDIKVVLAGVRVAF